MKEKIINLKNKIVSFFANLKNKVIPFIVQNKKNAIIALIILTVIIIAVFMTFSKKEIGNTTGNLDNSGFSVNVGKWVYYFGYEEGKTDGIYKVKRK